MNSTKTLILISKERRIGESEIIRESEIFRHDAERDSKLVFKIQIGERKMKRTLLPACMAVLCLFGIASAQTYKVSAFSDYVREMKGDTAVIKDYNDMGGVNNSLTDALNSDATPPAGRVYALDSAGYYPLSSGATTNAAGVTIVGLDPTILVNNATTDFPPVICGATGEVATTWGGNLTIKNVAITPAAANGTNGWACLGSGVSNARVVLDNCLFEHNWWVFVQSNANAGTRLFINNCYFVNMEGNGCRRNGGVYDNVNNNTDTIWVENSTHINAAGSMYKFRNFQIGKLFFNHNTFVDCAGSIFESLGYVSDLTVTNNIFVNCNLEPTSDSVCVWDKGETDPDNLPTGLVNCAPLPDSATQMPRKLLVDRNVIYCDPKFDDMVSTLKANTADGTTNWYSQTITMNTRTQSMFDNNTDYPYLTEGTWYHELPNFTDSKNLLTGWVDSLKAYSLNVVSQGNSGAAYLSDWRLVNPISDSYVYADFPIPVNLAYDNADLMTGGTMGEPVGDLNWFPTTKASFDMAAEHTALNYMLVHGTLNQTGVKNHGLNPATFALSQNYPNPFNPSTKIDFTIPKAGNVTLKVYNVLGQEVATLLDGFEAAQNYSLKFDASGLSSGIYFYTLKSGDQSITKKMLLLK
jgi:hypothetical protein